MKLALLLLISSAAFAQLPWEKNRDRVGLDLFRENCAVCHDLDKPQAETKKLGPSFRQLTQKRKRDYIGVRIRFGGQLMPAFAKKMSAAEIDILLDWLELKTGPAVIPATASGGAR